jgi:hypothetical protein
LTIRSGGNGGLPKFTIGNPKYFGGPRGHGGHGGFEPPPLNLMGDLAKKLFTSLGISSCKLTNFVPLGVCGMDLTPSTIWIGVDINGTSITIITYWGITT